MGKINFSYTNKKGKCVSGSAAFLHHVFTEKGGIQEYNDSVGAEYINAFIKAHSDAINRNIEKNAKRKNFNVV